MVHELDSEDIEMMLATHFIGRLACHASNRTDIIPFTYVYHDGHIYGHTNEGLTEHQQKLKRDRRDPSYKPPSRPNLAEVRG